MNESFILILVVGMLFTGTINTILNKLQDLQCVNNCQDPDPANRKYYEQPVWQTLNMFLGEAACLIVYYGSKWYENRKKSRLNGYHSIDDTSNSLLEEASISADSQETAAVDENGLLELNGKLNMLLLIPTLCDMTATTLMNVGLLYISASIYQMLRGSVVLFTGTFSWWFLKRNHPVYKWCALFTVFLGVSIVGLSGFVQGQKADNYPVSKALVGVSMVVFAQAFTASQFVIEEMILSKYNVAPLKAVGLEGLFGLISTAAMIPVFLASNAGKNSELLDLKTGWEQIISYPQIFYAGIGIIFSIAFFNWFGLAVTRHLSATSRSTIDTCRTIFIWAISLSLGWETFKWLQVVGFIVMLYG